LPGGEVVPTLDPGSALGGIGGSHAADVTGGMASKVKEMLALAKAVPEVSVRIFSGVTPGLVYSALLDETKPGTGIGPLPH
jgi:isopentenyl phosphate kinase